MSEWKEYKINELGKIGRGKSKHRPRNDASLFGGIHPFIQTGDVKEAEFYITKYSQTYSELGLAQSKKWKKGTLCITIAANIAETGILGLDACFPDSIIGFIPFEDKSDVRFIKYSFDLIKKHLQSISQGTTQDNLSQDKLLKFYFKAPDVKEQHRIASILSAYDDLIENNNRRIALLEQMAEQIYKEWFVRMRFPGYENTEFEKGVPKGWEWKKVEEVFKTSSGGTPSRQKEQEYYGGNIDWIKTGELKDNFIFDSEEKITDSGLKNSSTKLFPPQTLLMAMYGVNIGQLGISVKPSTANQAVCVFLPKEPKQYSLYYTFFFFKSIRSHLFNISMGAAQQNLSQDIIKRLNYLKPEISLLLDFEGIQKPMFDEILKLSQQTQTLKQTRDLLLPRLICGKLKVKELNNPVLQDETRARSTNNPVLQVGDKETINPNGFSPDKK